LRSAEGLVVLGGVEGEFSELCGATVEPVNGHLKERIALRRFTRRGLTACQAELLFAAMVLNLGKLLRLDPHLRATALPPENGQPASHSQQHYTERAGIDYPTARMADADGAWLLYPR
jgi:hypothetical protein